MAEPETDSRVTKSSDDLHLTSPFYQADNKTLQSSSSSNENENSLQTATETEREPLEQAIAVKIHGPGPVEPTQLNLSSMMVVAELRQIMQQRTKVAHLTCFSVVFEGEKLADATRFGTIPGFGNGSELHLTEEPYTLKDVRLHVARTNYLLSPVLFFNDLCPSALRSAAMADIKQRLKCVVKNTEVTPDCLPPDSLLPDPGEHHAGTKKPVSLSLGQMVFEQKEGKMPYAVADVQFSRWNPPSSGRKIRGDLAYLMVTLMEGSWYHVTATSAGFFVNRSTDTVFDPEPADDSCKCYTLIGLLTQLIPSFKKSYSDLNRVVDSIDMLYYCPVPCQRHSWIGLKQPHHPVQYENDQDAMDSASFGIMRDWIREISETKDEASLDKNNSLLNFTKKRCLEATTKDFVSAATKGAVAVVEGNLTSILSTDDQKEKLYFWNNIVLSHAVDSIEEYKDMGGDLAAEAVAKIDLKASPLLSTFKLVQPFLSALIMYQGHGILAQAVIPGNVYGLEKTHHLGSLDAREALHWDDQVNEMLAKVSGKMLVRPHKVVVGEKEEVLTIHCSMEVKGILTADGKLYLMDLYRHFPPDVNFLHVPRVENPIRKEEEKETDGKKEEGGKAGSSEEDNAGTEGAGKGEEKEVKIDEKDGEGRKQPREQKVKGNGFDFPVHKHKVLVHRLELQKTFIQSRYYRYFQILSAGLSKMSASKELNGEEKGDDELPLLVEGKGQVAEESHSDTPEMQEGGALVTGSAKGAGSNEEKETSDGENVNLPNEESSLSQVSAPTDTSMKADLVFPVSSASFSPDDAKSRDVMNPVSLDDPRVLEIMKKASAAVGSSSETEFCFLFNPDIYSGAKLADAEEDLERDRYLAQEVSDFLLNSVFPQMIQELNDLAVTPSEGKALSSLLHSRGINVRYMGKLAFDIQGNVKLSYVFKLALCEMLVRSAKHILREEMKKVRPSHLALSTAHFLNCFLGSCENLPVTQCQESFFPLAPNMTKKKKKNKKRKAQSAKPDGDVAGWASLTPSKFWKQLQEEVQGYFGYPLEDCVSCQSAVVKYGISRYSLLRRLCQSLGIQILAKEYNLESVGYPTFSRDDILILFPVVKYVDIGSEEMENVFESAKNKIATGRYRAAVKLLSDVRGICEAVYGIASELTGSLHQLLAKSFYFLENPTDATEHQQRAVIIFERCLGIDHADTITAYARLGLYCHAAQLTDVALRLMYRARYLSLIVFGEDHPEMATLDTNIGLLLHSIGEFQYSLQFLRSSLKLMVKYHGSDSFEAARSHHSIAGALASEGNFQGAFQEEKLAFHIYSKLLDSNHAMVISSREYLKELTQYSIERQKKVNGRMAKEKKGTVAIPRVL